MRQKPAWTFRTSDESLALGCNRTPISQTFDPQPGRYTDYVIRTHGIVYVELKRAEVELTSSGMMINSKF